MSEITHVNCIKKIQYRFDFNQFYKKYLNFEIIVNYFEYLVNQLFKCSTELGFKIIFKSLSIKNIEGVN